MLLTDANGRNERKWNAEDYEQEGTLTTGADGAFQWDTPHRILSGEGRQKMGMPKQGRIGFRCSPSEPG